eukprot:TRINITY_DN476_c0_g2_i6.p3 TRINITY_DN476_c0_g2~~TRINITY_DN476_c0_g2_i6.p3  ORF type:complete len:110 (-),score=0.37 TRINITY_DN476_c0_g2_i6:290-619(-)
MVMNGLVLRFLHHGVGTRGRNNRGWLGSTMDDFVSLPTRSPDSIEALCVDGGSFPRSLNSFGESWVHSASARTPVDRSVMFMHVVGVLLKCSELAHVVRHLVFASFPNV